MPRVVKSPACKYCAGHDQCILHGSVGDASLDKFLSKRISREYDKKEFIFFGGAVPTGVYMICSGRVKIYRTSGDGKSLITRVAGPGDMIGYRSVLASEPYGATAETMTKVVASHVPVEAFHCLMQENPQFSYTMLRKVSKELGSAEDRATSIVHDDARTRLMHTLADLAGTKMVVNGETGKSEPEIEILRQELAELTGLTLETTVRTLKALERDGVVELLTRSIRILDWTKLTDALAD